MFKGIICYIAEEIQKREGKKHSEREEKKFKERLSDVRCDELSNFIDWLSAEKLLHKDLRHKTLLTLYGEYNLRHSMRHFYKL